jgi:drug/metabolite transporter superfamily protein YnfA
VADGVEEGVQQATAIAPPSAAAVAPARRTPWLLPAALYLGVFAVLLLVSWQTISHTARIIPNHIEFWGDGVLGGLAHYDGGWYWIISVDGYRGHLAGTFSPVAFFPGYPLAMRYVGAVIGNNAVAGIVITATCGLGVSMLFWSWCRERMAAAAATTALLVLLLYPYGYFLYGVVYADTMFVFATLVAFWAVERDRPLLAGLAGAVATFTRPVGLAVVVGLVVRTLERRGALTRPRWFGVPTRITRPSAIRPRDGLVLLSVGGLAAYCGFLWHRFGDPFLFSAVEKYWGQEPGPRTWFKVAFFEQLRDHPDRPFTWGLVLQAAIALAAVATVPLVGRRFGWGYASYLLVVLAVPLVGTKDFMGLGRYGIAAFPVFALVGEHLAERPPRERRLVLTCSGLGLLLAGAGFAHGFYIT